jgi:glucose/arabinose dehydrogenase
MRIPFPGRAPALLALGLLSLAGPASAVPTDFSLTNIAPSIDRGTAIVQVADGRLFIAELGGDLKTYKSGTVTTLHHFPTSNARSEQGLFGLVEDPNYASNGWMYVHYFVYVNGGDQDYHVIMRFTLSQPLNGTPQYVDGSERLVYRLPNLPSGASRHNGGQLVFGNDGYLWMAKGEGEHQEQAEITTNVFGKIIRIDPYSTSASNDDVNGHYGIPPGNAGLPKPEIYAIGFRNPWSFAKDPSSDDLYIGDVGGTEEINRIIPSQHAGKKFGWGAGGNSGAYNCGDAAYVCPMLWYNGGAITGVAVKRPLAGNWPSQYVNAVFYSDHNGNWIRYTPIGQNNGQAFDASGHQPLGLMVGKVDGNLYYCRYNGGGLWQIKYEGPAQVQPAITGQPSDATVNSGNTATFSVAATGNGLAYQWQYQPSGSSTYANLADDAVYSGTATATLTIKATEAQAGRYRAVAANSVGSATSNGALLTVNPRNDPPVLAITSPAEGALFTIPEQISFSATATDPEQGALPASAFHWAIELGHRTSPTQFHTHPVTLFDGIKSGSFASTVEAEPSPQVWLLIICSVTDNANNTVKDTVLVYPRLVSLDVKSVPTGLSIVTMDQFRTDTTIQAAIGNDGRINGNTPQILNATRYDFDHWTFGGAVPAGLNATDVFQTFKVPDGSAAFTANYRATPNPVYAFKAVNGKYVTLLADARLQPNSATVAGDAQLLEMGDIGDGTLALKSLGNGKFCQAVGGNDVTCDVAGVSATAANAVKWSKVDNGDGTYSFKNLGTNQYLVAENGGDAPLKANRANIGGWEKFILAPQGPQGPQYGVTLAVGGGGGSTVPAAGSSAQVPQGGSLSVTAAAASGYKFDHWTASAGLTLANAAASATQVTNVQANGTVTAFFIVDDTPPSSGTLYSFKATNGQFVTLLADNRLQANSATVAGNAQLIEIGANADATLYFKAANGSYCQAVGNADVTCDQAAGTAAAAKWARVDNTDGTVSFKNLGTSQYLVAENGGAAPLKANRGAIGGWEKFILAAQTPQGTQYSVGMALGGGTGTTTPALGSNTQVAQGGNLAISAAPGAGFHFDHWSASAGLALADATAASTQVTNVQSNGTLSAFFVQDPLPPQGSGTLYAFKATNGQFATLLSDTRVQANSATVAGDAQVFEVGSNTDASLYLKAAGNGLYCQSVAADVTCDRQAPDAAAAKWTRVDNADGSASFKNLGTNGYLVAENGGAAPFKANRANIGGWEKFLLSVQTPAGPQHAIAMAIEAGEGTTTPAAGGATQVPEGSSLAISAVPKPGWLFDHWHASAGLNLSSSTAANSQVLNVQADGTIEAHFVVDPNASQAPRYAFKATNGQYVTLLADNRLQPNSATVAGTNQVLEAGPNGDGTVYLKALGNGNYCQAVGNADVTCDAAAVSSTAAKWTRVDNGDGTTSFKNAGTNGYLVAENGGAAPLKANRANIAGWEKFILSAQ